MSAAADRTDEAQAHPRARLYLCAVAAAQMVNALSGLSAIFYDYGHTDPLVIFAQRLTTIQLALAPFLAGAALALALMGRVRHAIIALAALILLNWIADVPSFFIHGIEWPHGLIGLHVLAQQFLYPLIAVAAIVLAWRGEQIAAAAILVSVPIVLALAGIFAFAIGVAIYGF